MDVLKDRVGGFTECTFMMACPVLLAVATKKVNISSPAVRHGIPPLAAISLFLCPLAFLLLWIGSWLKRMWGLGDDPVIGVPQSQPLTKLWILGVSKPLVHVSAIMQMLLAYMIFLLITLNLGVPSIIWLAFWCLVVIALGFYVVIRIRRQEGVENWEGGPQEQERALQENWWNKVLEMLLDLSAAVTSSLFLGLQVLALEEGQTNMKLRAPVTTTFFFCVFTSAVMLVATVPPIDPKKDRVREVVIHVLCALVALCLAAVVIVFLVFRVLKQDRKEAIILGTLVAGLTILPMFLLYAFWLWRHPAEGREYGELKPASLEMTKVTFAAFLAISSPSFSGCGDLSTCTCAFLVTAAMYVIFGVGWRFFSHFKQNAAIWTSKAACVFTHLFLAIAAMVLLHMATRTDDTCFPTQNTCSPTQNTTAT